MSLTLQRTAWMAIGLLPVLAAAQAGKLVIPDFSDLAKKATNTVDITLDGDMLKSASHFMGAGGGGDSANDVSNVVSGLKSISIRSFTFDKPDMYSQREVDGVLAQVDVPGWKKIVSVRDKGDHVEIHMRQNAEDGGLLIVAEKAQQLTIVNIAGKINMDQLRQLQGHMGVPAMPGVVGAPAAAMPPAPPAPPMPPAVVTPAPPVPAAQ